MKIPPQNIPLTDEQRVNIVAWLRALRSGEFSQAASFLKFKNLNGTIGYCCLGVACEIKDIPNTSKPDNDADAYGYYSFIFGEDKTEHRYPDDDWFIANYGFNNHHQLFNRSSDDNSNLALLNDSGFSFLKIAKIIETCFLNNEELYINKEDEE